ncbi:enoyl-CoA delta isomerase 1, mitochondrial-like [Diorhabda carinulata]|uniref:enoyl-CoA delta isomerase 1, mitochondrial-like n=1 Tax=Diorhabda carinulata TaxID=1163345 RepID=UPI0025A1E831|nr:enoyl-CoA delta isomerase 1, mitochondrial-like [Diorhabda carinulata]
MALRNLIRACTHGYGKRYLSNEVKLLSVSVNDKTGVATVEMQRPPVNSLNLDLINEISATLTDLENNNSRGLILTSKKDGVFSAGLDILEMYKPEQERLKAFWISLQDTWLKLYGSSYPTVALINGHSPAGGCLLSLCCEYRIMLKNYTIGLNETQLGIVAPKWFIRSMVNVIGLRQAELGLTQGYMFSTDEALKIGMIDVIVDNKEGGLIEADAYLQRFAKILPGPRSLTKTYIREESIKFMEDIREDDLERFLLYTNQPAVQAGLGKYIESLKKRSSKN